MITKTDLQQDRLRKKIGKYYTQTEPFLEKGFCPTKNHLSASFDKWGLFCIFNLGYYETLRFTELKTKIDGISSRMLTVTLKKLVAYDIVKRDVFAEAPPKVVYSLTDFGFALAHKLIDISSWFIAHSQVLRDPAVGNR
ncbi:MAG: winged helix-turn-helix transcriptional regulator [Flavobacteriaceae bacterium]|nr:winged helix-turn-helix transcriptional regulator [Flavobacteriaceae bacterium]